MDASGKPLGIVASRPNLLAFFADDRSGASVLAEGQDAMSGDLGVAEEHQGDHAVVLGGGGVIENGGNLGEMLGAEAEIDGLEGFVSKQFEALGGDFEDGISFEFSSADKIGRDFFVFGRIGTGGEDVLVVERRSGHALMLNAGGARCKGNVPFFHAIRRWAGFVWGKVVDFATYAFVVHFFRDFPKCFGHLAGMGWAVGCLVGCGSG